jgi:hypothetical protein
MKFDRNSTTEKSVSRYLKIVIFYHTAFHRVKLEGSSGQLRDHVTRFGAKWVNPRFSESLELYG